jgi:cytoskeletal protein CcmA (bactofilin family)
MSGRSWWHVCLLSLLLFGLTAMPALALDNRNGEVITIGPEETIDDDLVVSASTLNILGHVKGDVVALSSEINIMGEIDGDVLAYSPKVTVTGTIHGSLRTGGQTLSLSGRVDRNLTVVVQDLDVASPSVVMGNVILMGIPGGTLTIAGWVGRGVSAYTQALTLNARVARNVDVTGGLITFGPNAHVRGNVRYVADSDTSIPTGVVDGTVSRTSVADAQLQQQSQATDNAGTILGVLWLIGNVLLGLLAVHFLPGITKGTLLAFSYRPFSTLVYGSLFCIIAPIVGFVSALTLIGLPIGLLIFALWVAGIQLGWIFAASALAWTVVGRVQQGQVTAPREVLVIAGLLVLFLITRVPILGGPIRLFVLCMGIGALIRALTRLRFSGELNATARPTR